VQLAPRFFPGRSGNRVSPSHPHTVNVLWQSREVRIPRNTLLTFAFCSLYFPLVEETGNRWRRLHCLPGSHEPVAAC